MSNYPAVTDNNPFFDLPNATGIDDTEARVQWMEREGIIFRDCVLCAPFFKNPDEMGPRHNASSRCESGKRNHCSCSVCF